MFQLWPREDDGVSMTTSVLGLEDIKNILHKIRSTAKAYPGLSACKPVTAVSEGAKALGRHCLAFLTQLLNV